MCISGKKHYLLHRQENYALMTQAAGNSTERSLREYWHSASYSTLSPLFDSNLVNREQIEMNPEAHSTVPSTDTTGRTVTALIVTICQGFLCPRHCSNALHKHIVWFPKQIGGTGTTAHCWEVAHWERQNWDLNLGTGTRDSQIKKATHKCSNNCFFGLLTFLGEGPFGWATVKGRNTGLNVSLSITPGMFSRHCVLCYHFFCVCVSAGL